MSDDLKLSNAIKRILFQGSDAATEAQRLGKSKRTIERRLKAAREILKEGQPDPQPSTFGSDVDVDSVVSASGGSPSTDTKPEENPALKAAKEAAGISSAASPVSSTPADLAQANEDAIRFCTETVSQLKAAVGGAIVTFKYSPPLELSDRKVQELLAVGPLATTAIRANYQRLYPLLVKWMSGPYQVFGALAIDGLFMLIGLNSLAQERGWKQKEKKGGEKEQESGPPTKVTRTESTSSASAKLRAVLAPGAPDPAPGTGLDAPVLRMEDEAA